MAQREFPQHYPASGWVEHDAEDIWETSLATLREAVARAGISPGEIAAIGITNQRETTVIWDRQSGKPIHRAIVWQDRRTAETCNHLRAEGMKASSAARPACCSTRISPAPRSPGSSIRCPARAGAPSGASWLLARLITFLIWRLTGGAVHATDATNASRTLLFDIQAGAWDEELCRRLRVPMALLPAVKDSAGDYGSTVPALLGGAVAIRGVAGDRRQRRSVRPVSNRA